MAGVAPAIIMGISTAIAAGSTAYQIKSGMDQADAADKAAAQQKDAQDKALADQASQSKQMQDQQAQATAQASAQNAASELSSSSNQKRALAAGAGTRSDTILTSPLGLTTAPAQGSAKTLLGS